MARPDDGGENREGDPGVFIGGRLAARPLCRAGKGSGSSRLGMPRDRAEGAEGALIAEVWSGEPAEPELSESECRSEGSELSLDNVGLREERVGGELEEEEFWVTSMG